MPIYFLTTAELLDWYTKQGDPTSLMMFSSSQTGVFGEFFLKNKDKIFLKFLNGYLLSPGFEFNSSYYNAFKQSDEN